MGVGVVGGEVGGGCWVAGGDCEFCPPLLFWGGEIVGVMLMIC